MFTPARRAKDTKDALRVGLYMVRGPTATSRLRVDPVQELNVRYLAKGSVSGHGEEWTSSGHRDYDYMEWIARLTSRIRRPWNASRPFLRPLLERPPGSDDSFLTLIFWENHDP
jgi:hypothetical protein